MKADEGKTPWQYRTVTFLYFGTAGIISTFYYMFLQREVGLNLGMIGRVTAFGAVFSLASQPALGCLFSGTRKKKRFIRLYFLGLMAVLGAMTVVTERTVFLFAVLYGCLAIPMIGTYEIYLEAACRQEKMEYARIRKWGSVGMGVIAMFGGYIITGLSFTAFHVLGLLFLIVCSAIVAKTFGEAEETDRGQRISIQRLVGVKYIKPLYLVCFLGMGSYVGSDFAFSPYLTQLCENAETAGRIFGVSTGGKIFLEFVFFMFVCRAVKQFRAKWMLLSVFLFSFLRFACIATGILPVVILGDLLHCIVFPVFLIIIFEYLKQIVDDSLTAGCYSVISMLMFGLSNLVFPPLLSAAAEKAGFGIMYLTDCALAAAAFMIGACFLPDRDRNRGGDKFV